MNPYFSVVIPTYNRAAALIRTLESLKSQSFTSWEALIIDDGSTDDTAVQIAAVLSDPRFRYISQKNGGPSRARNRGMREASGEIIFYCDSDDLLYPEALAVTAEAYKIPAVTYSICGHRRKVTLIDAAGQTLATLDQTRLQAPATLQDFYNWDIKTTSTGLVHRRDVFAGKIEWKDGFLIEDLEFLMQLAVAHPEGFHYIPEYLLDYQQTYGGNGMCSGASYADFAHAFGAIYALHKNDALMTSPAVYLDRVIKYRDQHAQVLAGAIPPPSLKYFPDFWDKSEKQAL